ncbi:hypothetical protein llg_42460 [Luteolibacter sp. LG18]|nr:hypothetical protein llg_42460 [Luteolibacter sp. LG18]
MLSDFEYEFSDYRDGFLRDLLVSKRYDISERAARVEEFRAAVEGLPIFSKWLIDHVSDRQKISDSIKVIESRSSYCGKIDTWMNDHGSSFVMQYEEGEKHLKQENGSSQ